MQSNNSCVICLKEYNKARNQPRQLNCKHIICFDCAYQLYQQQKQIQCPLCGVATIKEPPDLELAFVPEKQEQNSKLCQIHSNQEMLLFCRNDLEVICQLCAFSEVHKSHDIAILKQAIEDMKKTEVLIAYEQKEMLENTIEKFKSSLRENQLKASDELKLCKQFLSQNTQKLINQILQIKQSLTQLLDKDELAIKEKFETEIQKADKFKHFLTECVPQNPEDIKDLFKFIDSISQSFNQDSLNLLEIKVNYQDKTQQICQQLNELITYQTNEK